MELHIAKNGVRHEKTLGKIYAAMRIMYFAVVFQYCINEYGNQIRI